MSGKYDNVCPATWGTCDTRSNRPPENKIMPHKCGEIGSQHRLHVCAWCHTPQAR
jgi:hypothetical protein